MPHLTVLLSTIVSYAHLEWICHFLSLRLTKINSLPWCLHGLIQMCLKVVKDNFSN